MHSKILRIVEKLLPAARHEKVGSLEDLHTLLPRLPFANPPEHIGGWLSSREQHALYSLARYTPGPILEIGPWLGRSTVCIARGIVDSQQPKDFLTCELAPTRDNFRPVNDSQVGFFYPPDSQEAMGICSMELFERDIKPVVEHPNGLLGQLNSNLEAMGVANIVSVFVGDFRDVPVTTYSFIFADTMHDENEINRNCPDLKQLVAKGSVLAIHDATEANQQSLRKHFNFGCSFTVDSLFVGEVAD